MALALRLGRTLDELKDSMSASEWALWIEYHKEAPIDDSRGDLHAAIVASTIANYAGKMRAENAAPASPADYMPFLVRAPEVPEEEPDPLKHFAQFIK